MPSSGRTDSHQPHQRRDKGSLHLSPTDSLRNAPKALPVHGEQRPALHLWPAACSGMLKGPVWPQKSIAPQYPPSCWLLRNAQSPPTSPQKSNYSTLQFPPTAGLRLFQGDRTLAVHSQHKSSPVVQRTLEDGPLLEVGTHSWMVAVWDLETQPPDWDPELFLEA